MCLGIPRLSARLSLSADCSISTVRCFLVGPFIAHRFAYCSVTTLYRRQFVRDPSRALCARIPYTLGRIGSQLESSKQFALRVSCPGPVPVILPVSNSPHELTVSISLIVPHGGAKSSTKSPLSPLYIRMLTFTQMQVALPAEVHQNARYQGCYNVPYHSRVHF